MNANHHLIYLSSYRQRCW